MSRSIVYWAHLPQHTDITKEGYVGVSRKNLSKREQQHRRVSVKGNNVFHKAIRKYREDIVFDVVVIASFDICLKIEAALRPDIFIGWNMAKGGGSSLQPVNKAPLSPETKKKISEDHKANAQFYADQARRVHTGRKRSDETKRKISSSLTGRTLSDNTRKLISENRTPPKKWEHPNSDIKMWAVADELFALWVNNDKCGRQRLAELFGVGKYAVTAIQKCFREGWNPLDDSDWQHFKSNYKEIK